MADKERDSGGFGPPPTRDQLIHMMQLFYESIVTARDELTMLYDERAEMAPELTQLHRDDWVHFAREIEKIWVEAYAIGRRAGFVPPPPPPVGEDPDIQLH